MNSPESPLDQFVNLTSKSTIAVIVPLFGYWNDIKDNPVNGEVLNTVLKRIYSNVHNILLIFVANPQTVPNDPQDPESVANIIAAKMQGGNVKNIPVSRNATYVEYVQEGMEYALQETQAQFMVVVNPWVMIQEGGIDAIVDRVNRAGDEKLVSGFDVRSAITPEGFDSFRVGVPKEQWDINFDFLATPRFVAEMFPFDMNYKTHKFLQVDIFQAMRQKGFSVISSQQIPLFPFDFPWKDYETEDMFQQDRLHFVGKWGFDPDISYEG